MAAICARLDGLPLAIELAAARVGHLPLPAILTRLDQRLTFLTGGARDRPDRLRTLRNAMTWSYDLLEVDEQRLLRSLAHFRGGFSLNAAEAISNEVSGREDDVLELVASFGHRLRRKYGQLWGAQSAQATTAPPAQAATSAMRRFASQAARRPPLPSPRTSTGRSSPRRRPRGVRRMLRELEQHAVLTGD